MRNRCVHNTHGKLARLLRCSFLWVNDNLVLKETSGFLNTGELMIVLQETSECGANYFSEIITTNGKRGWVNSMYLEPIH